MAVESGAQMVVAHHPLLLRGVDSVAADTVKGRLIHRLIRSGIALFTAHTNADSARPGVSDALAELLGLVDTVPIEPKPTAPLDKWVVMVPEGNAEQVSEAMFAVGAGSIGEYRDCSWSVVGTGQFEA
ncbi:Nif3-like dinuclear metal center hexameric protein, partial [Streptomyces sp. SID10244]|nr:Nif3-like dinuclear metal center hexameric protein [Streptomyces sp. SID10244]